MDEIEKNIIKNSKTKQTSIKRVRIKFEVKIK
jgi:hypothetical protein